MTREHATAEAQRRNVDRFRLTGRLDPVWVEVEAAPGLWEVREHRPPRTPLWRRAVGLVADLTLDLPDPPPDPRERRRRGRR